MKVHSTFTSINGEVCRPHQGSLTTFIRLFGCNLSCKYCDSQFSYGDNPFIEMRVRDIVREVKKHKCSNITLTGGEPLIQKGTVNLIKDLVFEGFNVSIETNGSIFIPHISGVSWVVDYKLPSSGCEFFMDFVNYSNLGINDFVKFVISDKDDFDRAIEVIPYIIRAVKGFGCPSFAFSPAFGKKGCSPETLARWMIKNEFLCRIKAIYSLQIHKILKVK